MHTHVLDNFPLITSIITISKRIAFQKLIFQLMQKQAYN